MLRGANAAPSGQGRTCRGRSAKRAREECIQSGRGACRCCCCCSLFQAVHLFLVRLVHSTTGGATLPSCRLTCTSGQPHVTAVAAMLPFWPCCALCCAKLLLTMKWCSAYRARKGPQREDRWLQMLLLPPSLSSLRPFLARLALHQRKGHVAFMQACLLIWAAARRCSC